MADQLKLKLMMRDFWPLLISFDDKEEEEENNDDESKNDSFQIPIMDNNSLDTSCWSLIRILEFPSRMGISSCHWPVTVNTRRLLVKTRQTWTLIG